MHRTQDVRVNKTGEIAVFMELTVWWGSKIITLTCMMSGMTVIQVIGKSTAEGPNLFRESQKAAQCDA